MSTHTCDVIKVKLEPHPNADSLSIVRVGGYECAVRTADWKDGDLAAYIPPDSVVPDDEQFKFLDGHFRIKVRKFRGRYSQGLLVPAPTDAKEGDDVMEQMGILHYEPPLPMTANGDNEKGPPGFYPKYDVENFNRYDITFLPGEEIVATEKIHGCNSRFTWTEGRIWAGSRNNWKKPDERNLWWQAIKQNPWIETWCKEHPGLVVYGEVYGAVQSLRYGAQGGQFFFAAFDILDKDQWLNYNDAREIGAGLTWVPELYRGEFDENTLRMLAEGPSTISNANHIREGIVIKPLIERQDPNIGRVQLKIVSNKYLEKN